MGGMDLLTDVATLRDHLGDADWIVFDCRHDLMDFAKGERSYREGHVPGAHQVPFESVLAGAKTGANGRHPLPDAAELAAFFNRHGVRAGTRIVAYDDVGGQYAARLWWCARWIGVTSVSILDGGWPKWIAAGGPVETAVPVATGGGTVVARPDDGGSIAVAELQAKLGSGGALVIDARTPERYRGETEPIDAKAGHIPSARNRFFKSNLNADLTFRSPGELRREFAEILGSRRAAEVVHQCGSGVTACVNLLAMEYAGLPGSRLYVGSWSEWIADPQRPIATGAEPGRLA